LYDIKRPNDDNIGVDHLPKDIRQSKILSGNDLARLANESVIPDETEVNEYKLIELSSLFMKHEGNALELESELHKRAKELISEGNISDAWKTLLSFNN
jgi:hypothetical protein